MLCAALELSSGRVMSHSPSDYIAWPCQRILAFISVWALDLFFLLPAVHVLTSQYWFARDELLASISNSTTVLTL
jgi:hypothetical protein